MQVSTDFVGLPVKGIPLKIITVFKRDRPLFTQLVTETVQHFAVEYLFLRFGIGKTDTAIETAFNGLVIVVEIGQKRS